MVITLITFIKMIMITLTIFFCYGSLTYEKMGACFPVGTTSKCFSTSDPDILSVWTTPSILEQSFATMIFLLCLLQVGLHIKVCRICSFYHQCFCNIFALLESTFWTLFTFQGITV